MHRPLIFILFHSCTTVYSSIIDIANQSAITHNLFNNYDKELPPVRSKTNVVRLGVYLNSFYSISEQSMDYALNIYLRQTWRDQRLTYESRLPNNSLGRRFAFYFAIDMVKLEDEMRKKIWVPDVFFRNEKKASFHYVTVPNKLVRVYSDGTVFYAVKVSMTLACPMQLHKYPLDTQSCPMVMESFGNTIDVVNFMWLENPVDYETRIELPQYLLESHNLVNCTQVYSTGTYSCLQINFILKRNIGYYLIQLYIPTVLIVILSWVGFWISMDAVPARVTIGLLTVLTMTTQTSSAGQSLPRVSYVKAIDIWLSVCLVFVFSSLLEFAIVNVISRRDHRREKRRKAKLNKLGADQDLLSRAENGIVEDSVTTVVPVIGLPSRKRKRTSKEHAMLMDIISRVLFPAVFTVFNITYWTYYLLIAKDEYIEDI